MGPKTRYVVKFLVKRIWMDPVPAGSSDYDVDLYQKRLKIAA